MKSRNEANVRDDPKVNLTRNIQERRGNEEGRHRRSKQRRWEPTIHRVRKGGGDADALTLGAVRDKKLFVRDGRRPRIRDDGRKEEAPVTGATVTKNQTIIVLFHNNFS